MRLPIRLRLTLAFAVSAAVVAILGALAFTILVGEALRGSVASSPAQRVDAIVADVTQDFLIGAATITVLGALGAWLLAGAALRPVEQMRREVAELSEIDPAASLNVPQTQDEIAALAATMNELLARLRTARARERRLVSDASHELRTPLAILSTEMELASRPGRSPEQLAEAILSARREVARLVRLADDLLLLARTDEGIPLDVQQALAVQPILEASARAGAVLAEVKGIRLTVHGDPSLRADLDPARIRQALDNLLSNALRHAPPNSEIALSAESQGDWLSLQLADRGAGFPPAFIDHAFERFRRADVGRSREEGGSGLGLAVVQAIAHAHGGEAVASNREGGGAIVSIRLPRHVTSESKDEDANDAHLASKRRRSTVRDMSAGRGNDH